MKVLLVSINAKYIHTNNAVRLLKANSDFDIDIIDFTIKDDIDKIIQEINQQHYDVIGFSLYIWNISLFRKIIDKLPLNDSKLVLGGPEVSYEYTDFLNNEKVSYIIKGEGEHSFNQLLHAIHEGLPPSFVPGIAYKKDNQIIDNPLQEIKDLDSLKQPYYFEDDIKHIPNKIAYIESSRGCPYKCSYCLSSLEKKVRYFSVDSVIKAIDYLTGKGAKTIKFLDRTFNANRNTLLLLEYIVNQESNAVFQFEITGDTLDTEIITYLNEHAPKGRIRFEIGIQSTNTETNLLVDRIQDNKKLFNNIKMIQDAGVIDLHLDLIAGLPKENKESFKNTFNEVFALNAKELQLGFLKMLKGTKIRREANKYGYIYNKHAPYEIIENNDLSKDDMVEIKLVEEMLDLFHNKGHFGDELLDFINKYSSPYDFFLDIGNYYITNKLPFRGYQIENIYQNLRFFLNNDRIYEHILIDYFARSKIKPKLIYKQDIPKETKHILFEKIHQDYDITKDELFKHSVVHSTEKEYVIAYYKNLTSTIIKYKRDRI